MKKLFREMPSRCSHLRFLPLLVFLVFYFWLGLTGWANGQTPQPQIIRLTQALKQYEQIEAKKTWVPIPADICLRAGDSCQYIPALRNNLILTRDLPPGNDSIPCFDEALTTAVKNFQGRHGLKKDGIIGSQTLAALNVTPAQRIQQLKLNLRRWQADTVGPATPKVLINIPDFSLQLLNSDYITVWQTRVIIGNQDKGLLTPLLTSKISYLVLNPTWNIPGSIIRREIIPIMKTDPQYLSRNNMILYRVQGAKKYQIPASSVNWHTADPEREGLMIIQSPGKDNALGQIKFIFDNPYHIYLHDTPVKSLFRDDIRTYSHGCVRVQYPETLAAYLLNPDWQKPMPKPLKIKESAVERIVFLPRPIPIRIGYYTSWVNDQGAVQFRQDIYKLDKFLLDLPIKII
jgi:L,D-transpeptidase YcbB